jgi:spermidine synthase
MTRIVERVESGIAELVDDQHDGWTLLVDGVEQSYVRLTHPLQLDFAYLRRLASVLDNVATTGTPQRVLHLGGGAMSLPRYVAATRPGSAQVVVERDAALVELVRRVLPLPPDADIAVHIGDARAYVESYLDHVDVVITDVFEGARMPDSVSSLQFVQRVAAVLRPRGVLAVNVTDLPPLTLSRIYAASLRAVFADVCLIAEAGLLRGRRYGNVILVASRRAHGLPVRRLSRVNAADWVPARVLHAAALDDFIGSTGPRLDASPA